MHILTINCGSSSLKANVIDIKLEQSILEMRIEKMNESPLIKFNDEDFIEISAQNIIENALKLLKDKLTNIQLSGVGHRVVHGGNNYAQPVLINEEVVANIDKLSFLAPVHNPLNLKGIQEAQKIFTEIPHVAVFDTAFHQTLPRRAQRYAIDKKMTEKHGIRRFGFHGTSHEYVAQKAAEYLQTDIRQLRLITCHLGNGCSMAAVEYGRSIETSMGMSPLEGLVMGNRSGDLDPGILLYLMKYENWNHDQLNDFLNKDCGLKGITGITNDMRTIIEEATNGNDECQLAISIFTHQVKKYIGAYTAIMGGVDAVIFTGGIGENSCTIRENITQGLSFLGIHPDLEANKKIKLSEKNKAAGFSFPYSKIKLLAIRTDEQLAIAKHTSKLIENGKKLNKNLTIPIAISARHVHLSQEDVEKLFGDGHQLTPFKPLSQPGQFACEEQVTIIGPKNRIERVRVLGPARSKTQVEISRTDEFFLGIDAPIRESGNTINTPGCILESSTAKISIPEGVICALRHIHMTPQDADDFGVKDKDIVEVKVLSERPLTFGNVLIRVSPQFKLEMHIDTDEANAAEISNGTEGALIEVGECLLVSKNL